MVKEHNLSHFGKENQEYNSMIKKHRKKYIKSFFFKFCVVFCCIYNIHETSL
jgi:hypothetical protein